MAKARAIVKRRKAVRSIRKITKTMQMIATAKFQKALKRATGTKPFTLKVRELVRELAASVGDIEHPLLRRPGPEDQTNRIALIVLTSNRGLAGAYNGSVLRLSMHFIREQEAAGKTIDLYVAGKKGISFFDSRSSNGLATGWMPRTCPSMPTSRRSRQRFIDEICLPESRFSACRLCELHQARPTEGRDHHATAAGGVEGANRLTQKRSFTSRQVYDFMPNASRNCSTSCCRRRFRGGCQAFLDATTSEQVMRMVAITSATRQRRQLTLTMRYNRAPPKRPDHDGTVGSHGRRGSDGKVRHPPTSWHGRECPRLTTSVL